MRDGGGDYGEPPPRRGGWSQNAGGRDYRNQSPPSALETLPYSIEAEQSTLGAMLIEGPAIEKASALITKDDFYRETHQTLCDVIFKLDEAGKPVDLVTVIEELRNRDKLDSIGGISYLTSLFEAVPTASNVEYYAKIVQEKSILRQMISASMAIIGLARSEFEDINDVLRQADEAIGAVGKPTGQSALVHVRVHLGAVYDEAADRADAPKTGWTGVDTGLSALNYRTGGWQAGDFILLAARPSIGKTSLARRFALTAAGSHGLPTAFFSAEMPAKAVTAQMACAAAKIDFRALRNGDLSEEEWTNFNHYCADISKATLWLRDKLPMTVDDLSADLRELERQVGQLGLVVVDYLQLLRTKGGGRRSDTRTNEVDRISQGLKEIARRFSVPVIALSQLSRAVEMRENKRPMLSDLRESGGLEADADVIMFLYRDDYYLEQAGKKTPNPDEEQEVEVIFGKHRMGPTGTDKISFVPRYARFF